MANLTIRKLDDVLKAELRQRAAANGRSMEDEVRGILRDACHKRLGFAEPSSADPSMPSVPTPEDPPEGARAQPQPGSSARVTLIVGGGIAAYKAMDLIRRLKERGARDLRFVCLLAAPEGLARFQGAHPDVPVWTAAIDSHLNDHGYIVPGLGDAGDRMYGTK